MKKRTTDIVICGVGGQGIILASNVLCFAAFSKGFDVKKSEVHGMAQRGGSVITHVRYGEKVYSPLIEPGKGDIVLAFEKLEALRYIHYLKKGGIVIVNDRAIPPMSVLTGIATYPLNIKRDLKKQATTYFVKAENIAQELGNLKIVNIILLGVLAKFLPFPIKSWKEAIKKNIKTKFVDINIKAFTHGMDTLNF